MRVPYSTRAIIDLDAIASNLAAVRQLAGDRAILMALKANGYGHGSVEVARMIQTRRAADWLGVATVPEGQELRDAGITLPILKLSHCFEDELDAALAADIALTVVDSPTIASAEAAAARSGRSGRSQPVHLKLDSGMRRIGSELTEGVRLAREVDAADHLELQGIFTHLPISDAPAGDEYTRDQIARFTDEVAAIERDRGAVPFVHAANSGGVLNHDLGATTMVRPGIMAYGYNPEPTRPSPVELRRALSLVSRVSFVKTVPAGDTVGYGRTWAPGGDIRLATVPVGYADGYSRLLSNRGWVLIGGVARPIRGRVCMDQIMVEVDDSVQVGDEVVLIGRQGDSLISTDEVASLMQTISYEVTCLIAPRVTRTYIGG